MNRSSFAHLLEAERWRRAAARAAVARRQSRLVEPRGPFVWRELCGRKLLGLWPHSSELVHAYLPRGSDLNVFVRHFSSDMNIVEEVFGWGVYRMPAVVRRRFDEFDAPARVLDLGGHIGIFGAWLLTEFPDATLTSLEPDVSNAALLQHSIRANGKEGQWRLEPTVAAAANGTVPFVSGAYAESQTVELDTPGAVVTPARDVFSLLSKADLVKIDIEGGEWAILMDPRFCTHAPPIIVLEYHPQGCPRSDPREAALAALSEADFHYRELRLPDAPEGVGMVWGWKRT